MAATACVLRTAAQRSHSGSAQAAAPKAVVAAPLAARQPCSRGASLSQSVAFTRKRLRGLLR